MSTLPYASSSSNTNQHCPGPSLAAMHYAAHAVIAHLLDVEWGDVRVRSDRGHHVEGGSDDLLGSENVADVWRGAAVRLAGTVAEYVATGNEGGGGTIMGVEIAQWPGEYDGDSFDRYKAYMHVAKMSRKFVKTMPRLVAATFALVRDHFATIKYVARELDDYDFVSAGELLAIMGDETVSDAIRIDID